MAVRAHPPSCEARVVGLARGMCVVGFLSVRWWDDGSLLALGIRLKISKGMRLQIYLITSTCESQLM